MQVSVETTSGLGRRMKVQIPADKFDREVESKLKQLARSVRLDGFRPGKVPMSVVKQRYETQVREETAGELIASSYEEALQQENLKPAGHPNIERSGDEPGQELEYVATFEVYPDIELPDLSDVTLDRVVAEVVDSDVDNMIEKLRKQRVTWTNAGREAAEGDRLEIDFEGTVDGQPFPGNTGKNVPLELGSGSMIPGFEEQLLGAKAGDNKTVEVTFPADYASSDVAGKAAKFDVTVNAVAEAVLPDVNDEFARAFGVGDGGISKLRAEVRANMERELAATIKSKLKQQIFEVLLQKAIMETPTSLIESEIDALSKKESGADEGVDRSQFEEEARRRVSLGLLIAEIMQRNQLQVDPQRVRETIEALAQSYEKPEEVVQWYYSNQEMLSGIQTLVMEDTVTEWISGQAKVAEISKTFDEVMQS
jgi:trigger factor